MKITLFLFLIIASLTGWAQEVIYMSPVQDEHVKLEGSVKGMLKKNTVSKDSLVSLMNQRIIRGLKAGLPGAEFMFVDSTFLKLLADSSVLKQMNTTTSLDVINGVAGSINTKAKIKGGQTYYDGRNFTPLGIVLVQKYLRASQAKYLVLLNKVEAGSNFVIHFELYDRNFTKLYGDKFTRPSKVSGNMYFSAFSYYMSNFVEEFDVELVSKLKIANTIH